jgi:rubredoxin
MRGMADDGAAACAGKAFENHPAPVIGEDGRWTCPACGTGGEGFRDLMEQLALLTPLLHRLRAQMLDQGATFLVPTDGATGPLGTFYGLDVLRAPGLPRPMIALREPMLSAEPMRQP